MLYELRVYDAMPGKLGALNDRFANHTTGFFKNYGIGIVGFWTAVIGTGNQLTYILSFDSMADREDKWSAFQADPAWQKARAESERDGTLVAGIQNSFMRLTPYSPEPKISTNLQELWVNEAVPGKLPALNSRFADHTIHLFEKHGIRNVGYWTQEVGTGGRLFYMVGHASLADREKNWAAFTSDPDWLKARAESERDGPLSAKTQSSILQPTSYSPR